MTLRPWFKGFLSTAIPLALATGFILILFGLYLWCANYMVNYRTTHHRFDIPNPPEVLTEEDALTFARQALQLDGYDLASWKLDEYHRPASTDETAKTGKSIVRSPINPNQISMLFLNPDTRQYRGIMVELEGTTILVSVVFPK